MLIGYARVSSRDQNLETQLKELDNFGVDKIISEKISGIVERKTKLDGLIAELSARDTVVVTRMDRLGRSTIQLLQLVDYFQEKDINLVVLNMGIDTRTSTGKFFLTIMAAFSELDRTLIKEKQRNGIEIAKKKGLYKGRPPKYTKNHPAVEHALELRQTTDKRIKDISDITGISEATLYRRLKEIK